MKPIRSIVSCVLLFVCTFAHSTLIYNVNGYSIVDNTLTRFTAIAFKDDKITAIYQQDDTLPKGLKHIDGQGKTLIPGLIDAHGHVLNYGLSLMRVDLNASQSEQHAVELATQFRQQQAKSSWLLGRGWNQEKWQQKQFPTTKSLDEYFKDVPVWLTRVDGHAGWANKKAMELAGITAESVSPDGGQIVKDKDGQPTGIFVDNAMSLITNNIPPLSKQETEAALLLAMNTLAKEGITSVHDAGVGADVIAAFKTLTAKKAMPIRVNAMIAIDEPGWQKQLQAGLFKSADGMFQVNSVKISADGALGSRGAALIAPYSDESDNKGLLLYKEDQLTSLMTTAMQAGFQVNTHAIGDYANKIVLDNYQQLIKDTNTKSLRHRVEHAQVLQLSDVPRFAQLGVIASMQSTHATSDKNMAEDRLGADRILGAYAWRKLLESGAVIASGSDFPVEAANPMFGLHAAVTRQDKQNQPEKGWYAAEKMTLTEALKSFTVDAAYAAHQEHLIGQLVPGYQADFILLDQDLFTIAAEAIWQVKVEQTWVAGKRVY